MHSTSHLMILTLSWNNINYALEAGSEGVIFRFVEVLSQKYTFRTRRSFRETSVIADYNEGLYFRTNAFFIINDVLC